MHTSDASDTQAPPRRRWLLAPQRLLPWLGGGLALTGLLALSWHSVAACGGSGLPVVWGLGGVATGAADGFNVMAPTLPYDLQDFVALVIPELQRRGLFRTAYTGRTLREHLGLPRPLHPAQARRQQAERLVAAAA